MGRYFEGANLMAKVIAVTQSAASLSEVEGRFNLSRIENTGENTSENTAFFGEWQDPLPDLDLSEANALAIIYRRLQYHRIDGDLLEGAVTLLVASPLLELAGLYDPPYKLRSEASVEITIDDSEEILRGRIDALILQDQLWVLILEAKKTTIPLRSALPQLLTYLMASPTTDRPLFGMVTNGDEVLFIKLAQQPVAQYDLSRAFSLYTLSSELTYVFKILKKIGQVTT
jgi:hypothetical protein